MTQPKIPYRQKPKSMDDNFTLDREDTPLWANLLYSSIINKEKIEDTFKKFEKDPSLAEPALKGLIGQYLLNKGLPSNIRADLKNKALNFEINDKLNLGLRKDDDTTFLDLGWRF